MKAKLIVLPMVCFVTFLVTSHLMERAKQAKAQAPVRQTAVQQVAVEEDTQPIDPSFVSSESSMGFVAQSNPATFPNGQFPAQASGTYINKDSDQTLFWSLVIQSYDTLDASGSPTVVFSQTYDPFQVSQGTSANLSFSQAVPLAPGSYVAQINLQTTSTVYDPSSQTTSTGNEIITSDNLYFTITP